MKTREELGAYLGMSLANADNHRRQANAGMALNCLSDAIKASVRMMVRFEDAAVRGDAVPEAKRMAKCLRRLGELNNEALRALVETGRSKYAPRTDAILIHFAWFLGETEVALNLAEAMVHGVVVRQFRLTPLWMQYGLALRCLARGEVYEPAVLKPKGEEKYYETYLGWFADLSAGEDTAQSLDKVKKAFAARQSDKRIKDWTLIDGDGEEPVCWDFRMESTLRFRSIDCRPGRRAG